MELKSSISNLFSSIRQTTPNHRVQSKPGHSVCAKNTASSASIFRISAVFSPAQSSSMTEPANSSGPDGREITTPALAASTSATMSQPGVVSLTRALKEENTMLTIWRVEPHQSGADSGSRNSSLRTYSAKSPGSSSSYGSSSGSSPRSHPGPRTRSSTHQQDIHSSRHAILPRYKCNQPPCRQCQRFRNCATNSYRSNDRRNHSPHKEPRDRLGHRIRHKRKTAK